MTAEQERAAVVADAEYRTPISTLPPFKRSKEERAQRKAMLHIVQKVIKAIVIDRPTEDMLVEVYFAGMWHGAEVMRQKDLPHPPAPRERDVILVAKPRRARRTSQGRR